MKEEVYIDPPRVFILSDGISKVLILIKGLYGLSRSPKTFFDELQAGLLEKDFIQSKLDPCLFMKYYMLCLVYLGNMIIAGPNR